MNHLIDSAKGALKLLALHMQYPNTVSREQLAAVTLEAIENLDLFTNRHLLLQETYNAVRAVIPINLRVAVAPSSTPSHPVDVFIFAGDDLIDVYTGKTPNAIAEFLRLKYMEVA